MILTSRTTDNPVLDMTILERRIRERGAIWRKIHAETEATGEISEATREADWLASLDVGVELDRLLNLAAGQPDPS